MTTVKQKTAKSNAKHKFGQSEQADFQVLIAKCRELIPNCDEQLIKLAFSYCIVAHAGKLRKSGDKFYTHPLAVAFIIIQEIPLDNEAVVAALLHNVLDESDIYTYEDIRFTFGTTIAQIVEGIGRIKLVESQHIDRPDQMDNYRKLLISLFTDIRIILIKLADKLHNLRTLSYIHSNKQQKIAQETLEVYVPFANRFGLRKIKFELEDLAFKYLNSAAYKYIEDTIQGTHEEREKYVERFKEPIIKLLAAEKMFAKENVTYKIYGRAKHIYSIYNKTLLRKKEVKDLYDIFAIRIILDTDNPLLCFYTYGIIANYYKPIPETFKDYISKPKENGYSSLHTAVAGPDGRIVEVQIRTAKMHQASEVGIAAHFRYKSGINSLILEDNNIQNWLDEVRYIFENIGNKNPQKLLGIISNNMLQDKIYVFTVGDEFRQLPKGATVLDFAFLYTDVALNCIGAKINGKLSPINYVLNSGDKVEIISSKKQEVSIKWLDFVVTSQANSQLNNFFKNKENQVILKGKEIWNEENKKNNFKLTSAEMQILLQSYNFETENDFFKAIGENSININKIYQLIRFKISDKLLSKNDSDDFNSKNDKDKRKNQYKNFYDFANYKFNFFDCCNPLPGDSIFGIIETQNIISVHNANCYKYKKLLQIRPDDIIPLDWDIFSNNKFQINLHILAEDRENLVAEILNKLIDYYSIQITSISFDVKNSMFEGFLGFMLNFDSFISEVIASISTINGVQNVVRFELPHHYKSSKIK